MKAVRFDDYGDASVLELREVAPTPPKAGQVMVVVSYAGINPGEIIVREGIMREIFPCRFPDEGQGSDFAGVVAQVGEGVEDLRVGDAVIGMSDERNAQAERVTIDADRLVPMPEGLDPRVAGGLYVVATTAQATIDVVAPRPGETVVVSAAAGGVGILAAQLARRAGADVVGIAGPANGPVLRDLGIRPVEYGEGVVERLREAAPDGVDAFIDCFGAGYVEIALRLGVAPERIDTIVDFSAATRHGTPAVGMAAIAEPAAVVSRIAGLIAAGELVLPIRDVYPFTHVRSAYDELSVGHGVGKIVLCVN